MSLPRTVAKIEANAFDGCSALTSVSLPEGVEIAHWAFHGLPASAAVSYGGTQAQWDAIGAAKGTTTAELVFGASGAAAPKVQVQSSTPAPGQPASLTLSGQMGSLAPPIPSSARRSPRRWGLPSTPGSCGCTPRAEA